MLLALQVLRHLINTVVYGTVGVLITLVVVLVTHLNGRPDLNVWHTAELDEEFTADSPVATFQDYLALEARLFAQLDEQVYARTASAGNNQINRYQRGALADPGRWPADWNRSFLMESGEPGPNVLMLHGLSDAPYSLRTMAKRFHRAGATVLGLRIPGHGTAPSGLSWPSDVHSLSHVALPFPPEDPLYGGHPIEPSPGIHLGDIAVRGERGALAVSEAALARLRWNPFYSYLEERALAFVGLK